MVLTVTQQTLYQSPAKARANMQAVASGTHCCNPNLFVQSVFVEYSRAVHRIGIFAARDIMPYEELTYDYGYVVGSVEGKTLRCLCGAPGCRDFLF